MTSELLELNHFVCMYLKVLYCVLDGGVPRYKIEFKSYRTLSMEYAYGYLFRTRNVYRQKQDQ